MKKTLLAVAAMTVFAGSALAVDLSHDFSYGSTVATGNIVTTSKSHTDSQTFKFAQDSDAGRNNGVIDGRIVAPVGPVGHLNGADLAINKSASVDNLVSGDSFESSFTHSTTNGRDEGTFSSITVFNEATISVGGLKAGEGNRVNVYSQDMEGYSHTKGYTDTTAVDVVTSANPSGVENGVEYKFDTSHTDFTSNVDNKVVTTRKNTITDYSFIK